MRPRRPITTLPLLILAAMLAAGVGSTAASAASTSRITAGSSAFTDAAGQRWRPAGGALQGGHRVHVTGPLELTASPRIYRTVADGVVRARLRDLDPGLYAVTLYLAKPAVPASSRTFTVSAGGVRRRVRIGAGRGAAATSHAFLEVPVGGRELRLRFTAGRGRPAVAAIEAQRLGPLDTPALRPAWRDTFDGPAGTPPVGWAVAVGGAFGPTQHQAYTGSPRNLALDGAGNLLLTARRETVTDSNGVTRAYSSGRVQSIAAYPLRRARLQARIRIPGGPGLWPAFWGIGTAPLVWPASGEVDIMELVTSQPGTLHGFVHGPVAPGSSSFYQGPSTLYRSRPLSDAMHTYAMRSEPGVVEFRFDGRPYGSITKADIPRGAPWLMDRDYHLVFSLAVGGWAGSPSASTPFPARMTVADVQIAL